MKTNNYLFLSLCLCIPLFALTGCDNDSSEEPILSDMIYLWILNR